MSGLRKITGALEETFEDPRQTGNYFSILCFDALEQMAVKGDHTCTRSNKGHHAKTKAPRRKLKICCLCDVVTGYLSTHLRLHHDLTSSQLAKVKKRVGFTRV